MTEFGGGRPGTSSGSSNNDTPQDLYLGSNGKHNKLSLSPLSGGGGGGYHHTSYEQLLSINGNYFQDCIASSQQQHQSSSRLLLEGIKDGGSHSPYENNNLNELSPSAI